MLVKREWDWGAQGEGWRGQEDLDTGRSRQVVVLVESNEIRKNVAATARRSPHPVYPGTFLAFSFNHLALTFGRLRLRGLPLFRPCTPSASCATRTSSWRTTGEPRTTPSGEPAKLLSLVQLHL